MFHELWQQLKPIVEFVLFVGSLMVLFAAFHKLVEWLEL